MEAGGFRAASAYVEITARLDRDTLLGGARDLARDVERSLQDGGVRAGRGLTEALRRGGTDAAAAVAKATQTRLRDESGRFRSAGERLGEEVGAGAGKETDRNGFRAFLGLVKAAPKAGGDAARGLLEMLGQGLKGPAGPYMIAGLSAGAAVAGPLVGAAIAGGIIAGIATAGIGGGVILAAKDPAVKHAWAQTGSEIGDILQDAAAPFRAELIKAADRGTAAFQRWGPMFKQIFGVSSTMLDPFLSVLEYTGDRLLPTIMTTINMSGPAVGALTRGLKGTVDAVADIIDQLGDNGPEAAAGLTAAFFLVNSSIRNVGHVVNGLTEGFGFLIDKGIMFAEFLVTVGDKLYGLPGPLGEVGEKLRGLRPLTEGWRDDWDGLKGQIKGATDVGSQGTSQLAERTQFLALSMGAAIREAGSLSEAFRRLNGGALSAREAESAYQAAIDGVTASIKANGKSLDLRTEKGRANDAALRALITTTDAKAQATYDETAATKGAAAAEAAAAKVYEQGRNQLIKSAQQMGLSRQAAIAYADKIMSIPKSWSTTVSVNDQATSKVVGIKKTINSITGKTVYVNVIETRAGHRMPGQGTQLRAGGGDITGGSGFRDDVPVLAMGGEFMIQKAARRALEREFGPEVMSQFNTWHLGGRGGPAPRLTGGSVEAPSTPARSLGGGGTVTNITIQPGAIVLDASKIRSIQDLLDLMSNLATSARSMRAGAALTARG